MVRKNNAPVVGTVAVKIDVVCSPFKVNCRRKEKNHSKIDGREPAAKQTNQTAQLGMEKVEKQIKTKTPGGE